MVSSNDKRKTDLLPGLFRATIYGKRQIATTKDAKLFLESLQNEDPPSLCIEKLLSSPSGLNCVAQSVRIDLSASFARDHTLKLLAYLSDPGVEALADGLLLKQVLEALAQPPTMWRRLVDLCLKREIQGDDLAPFAWMLVQLVSSSLTLAEKSILDDARSVIASGILSQSSSHAVREFGYKLVKLVQLTSSATHINSSQSATRGGRHDNDFANFRDIAIYPTTDELLSTKTPFYRTADEVFEVGEDAREGVLIDNQFRLLREDMLAELREDMQIATGRKKSKRKPLALGGLVPVGLDLEAKGRNKPCTLAVRCHTGLEQLKKLETGRRKKYLSDHPSFLKHQAFGVLYRGDEVYGFAFVERDIDRLCKSPPEVLLQFTEEVSFRKALSALKVPQDIQFTLVGTPVFAYEPVLRGLKEIRELPLEDVLLNLEDRTTDFTPASGVLAIIRRLESGSKTIYLGAQCSADGLHRSGRQHVEFDDSQRVSLINALSSPVSIIQGPPGTGKSFIGAQIVKCLYQSSESRILVITYTNHALDQFLEDLIKTGIPEFAIVRLGSRSKCTDATRPLILYDQKHEYRRPKSAWDLINLAKEELTELSERLEQSFKEYRNFSLAWPVIEEHLEFSENDFVFLEALQIPEQDGNWKVAGNKGKGNVKPSYLFNRWMLGQDAGAFRTRLPQRSGFIWTMDKALRHGHVDRWMQEILGKRLDTLQELFRQYKETHEKLETMFKEGDVHTLKNKRIIGCTTTAASKYAGIIRQAAADVVLAEEAGEILESHILTSVSSSVKQLILIGDHKQLRPKVNNYALSVEKGAGFDLNRSLFERLIRQDAPFWTLHKQHRMVPEISRLPREMTYPDLVDGPKTGSRAPLRGVRDRVIFIHHDKLEIEDSDLIDRRDPDAKSSKMNAFEGQMVLKCVRYLAQQGYKTEHMVVLTPYLGQLRLLLDMLKSEHDPILNDLDSFEMIRAGLQTEAGAKVDKRPLRISTIDNYQGEESDIVIASLTRSNKDANIGFMQAPERLNVLVSRARDCLIMIGNSETFMKSKRGKETWCRLFELLKAKSQLYDGLPVRCERHPERTAVLSDPSDFDKFCPDGGCAEPCNMPFKCGQHKCELRCHRVSDHSKIECTQLVKRTCKRGHQTSIPCSQTGTKCAKCVQEDIAQERRLKRDLQLEEVRLRRETAYRSELEKLQDEAYHLRLTIKCEMEAEEQKKTLQQQRADIDGLKATALRTRQQKQKEGQIQATKASIPTNRPSEDCVEHPSGARQEWEEIKRTELAVCKALDSLMEMIGLEGVKESFLGVKNRVDTAIRQNISLKKDRFNCSLLGNPGTGKTTVARLYAELLTSVGAIPGSCFKETTGSSLANGGITGCEKLIDEILTDGGGVLFIDEAYQLTSGNSYGGAGVLDYLLPKIEELVGQVVFVLAGYNKQMESFFAHNPGLPSRFPIDMKFDDYSDEELLSILGLKIGQRFSNRMQCEDGLRGLYCRIASRRIGRGRGREGFGNARAVENVLTRILNRQATRLRRERKAGKKPDDMWLTKEDLIGPEPSGALSTCTAWKKLQSLIGLGTVKEAVRALLDSVQHNYDRELAEQPLVEYSLNKIFLGSPGTGKTTVAKLYGEILSHLGLLSRSEVVVKNPSDFVGGALGQSEQQTKGILAASVGKVLVIDEAYGLYGGSGGQSGSVSDPYKSAVIDTIVAEVQSVPGDDRCVLLLGYKDQMEDMLQNVNPGLARRFPLASAFVFEDFTDDELRELLDLKLKQHGFGATNQAKQVAMEMLQRARNRPNFGNAGEIDIILDTAKARQQRRISGKRLASSTTFEAVDFDPNFDRAMRSETNIKKLFEGDVGREQVIEILEDYQRIVRKVKDLDMDPKENIPFNFLFRGPPGTGKTTTAKKMGKFFYDLGFLATAEVIECSASDLVAQYVGQTGPKVRNRLDNALGRVLFIDEAYRLGEGHFAKEAVDELVDSITKSKYKKKLVIILAGYEKDINQLISTNTGLSSRFPEQESWGSARDVNTLAKEIFNKTILAKAPGAAGNILKAEESTVYAELERMFSERTLREQSSSSTTSISNRVEHQLFLPRQVAPTMTAEPQAAHRNACAARTTITAENRSSVEQPAPEHSKPLLETGCDVAHAKSVLDAKRDAGVSDAVWEQLERDKRAQIAREQEYERLLVAQREASETDRRAILERLLEEKKRREEEKAMQKKLMMMGRCPMGYEWIKQSGGYRCAGGSHFVSDKDLAANC